LLAQFAPIDFFVLVEKGTVGKLGRKRLELRPEMAAPRQAGAYGYGEASDDERKLRRLSMDGPSFWKVAPW